MASRRVFIASNARLSVHHGGDRPNGTNPAEPMRFDGDEAGLAEYSRYLHRYPAEVTCVIADVVEEEFREDTVPHVPAWERRAVLRNRAARAFGEAGYVHFAVLGREQAGRRDDHVLFSAISRSGVLAPWLEPMERHAVPLAGVWSPALLTAGMLTAIGAQGESVLIATLQSNGGLRQTWLRHGRLRLSRLASVTESAGDRGGAQILAEIARTRRYLDSLNDTGGTSRLEVHILGHGAMLDALRRAQSRDTGQDLRLDCALVDLADVACRLGLRPWDGGAVADRLFVHALLVRPPSGHYAPPEATCGFNTMRIRAGLNAAAAVLLAGGCVAAGVTAVEGVTTREQARSLGRQAAVYELRYREAQATLPATPVAPADLDRAVEAANLLRERRADPVVLFAIIGRAAAKLPHVRVERIAWRTSAQDQSFADADADAIRGRAAGDGPIDPRRSGEAQHRAPKALFQVALVSARIEPFDGNYRAAMDTVHRFVDSLSASDGVGHVRILELPLDLSPGRTLSGDMDTGASDAAFELVVSLPVASHGSAEV